MPFNVAPGMPHYSFLVRTSKRHVANISRLASRPPPHPALPTLNHSRRQSTTASRPFVHPSFRVCHLDRSCFLSPRMERRHKSNGMIPPTIATTTKTPDAALNGKHEHEHEHQHDESDGHSHAHGGIFHTHEGHAHGDDSAEALVKFIKGEGLDRGTKVTVLGLFTNVGLTAMKGAAGWSVLNTAFVSGTPYLLTYLHLLRDDACARYFHSASLLAEAGHSLSDLLADFVTLACWRTSRQPPTDNYPYGFGKYESMGTTFVSEPRAFQCCRKPKLACSPGLVWLAVVT